MERPRPGIPEELKKEIRAGVSKTVAGALLTGLGAGILGPAFGE